MIIYIYMGLYILVIVRVYTYCGKFTLILDDIVVTAY
jgi:hypothetical protein